VGTTLGLVGQGCLRLIPTAAGFRVLEHEHEHALGVAIEQSGTLERVQVIGGHQSTGDPTCALLFRVTGNIVWCWS
jgi:hypothetical protein